MGKYTVFYNQKIFNMKKSLVLATILMMAVSCATTKQTPEGMVNPENKKEWKLVWKDEFNYKDKAQLLKVWESANGPEGHILCSRWEENIELGDGTLRLVNHKENRGGQEWTSGSIWTRRDFMYGYYECRYKIAAAPRTNSSFWITSRDKSKTPEKGLPFEIDINGAMLGGAEDCSEVLIPLTGFVEFGLLGFQRLGQVFQLLDAEVHTAGILVTKFVESYSSREHHAVFYSISSVFHCLSFG